ncbi:MAG: leucine--tRNA ligase [Clostridiales bacterium]|jgi:leucyl-tRNA synthetase|nr:leucine--tRNA ligase [Clostridiales bacterium]
MLYVSCPPTGLLYGNSTELLNSQFSIFTSNARRHRRRPYSLFPFNGHSRPAKRLAKTAKKAYNVPMEKKTPKPQKPKYYVLEMFSYPSSSKLHMGHWYNYGLSDSFARFKKMKGFDVFQPMGFDAFGLPAENYAIKTGVHPADSTRDNIATMEVQLKAMNAMFDWDAEIKTCEPDYYKWTQWLFLKLYERGLAYQKEAPVNWCLSCKTVIANEQVKDGECERCGAGVEKKFMKQWFFRITDYAEELIDGLDKLDWPEKTKLMQKNWIGKSEGAEVSFASPAGDFKVFTTRADTLAGVTYVVLAPEHALTRRLTTPEHKNAVEDYIAQTARQDDVERLSAAKEKTGVFTGAYAVNPLTDEPVPVYIADYVLATYGTGAVMAVPAHDGRDYAFAKKYNLPIKQVILPVNVGGGDKGGDALPEKNGSPTPDLYEDDGVTANSGDFSGLRSAEARYKITAFLRERGRAEFRVNYRLRDWSVSRQRYWGSPIPIVYCPEHGAVPVPEKDLPVLLPYDVNFTPDGRSPLSRHDGYMNTTCPICGKAARRDPDTLDTFVCSSWYYLRYPFSKSADKPWDKRKAGKILPVDKYVGGAEHACMHLLYARFIARALRDAGWVDFDEPFTSLVHQGIILGPDGNRMSKSKGNTVSPDDYVNLYGADVLRLYLAFGFSYIEGGPWNDDGIRAVAKFAERVGRLMERAGGYQSTVHSPQSTVKDKAQSTVHSPQSTVKDKTECTIHNAQCAIADKDFPTPERETAAETELLYVYHNAVKSMAADFEVFSFNTAVARYMELVNALYKYDAGAGKDGGFLKEVCRSAVKLIAPLAPVLAQKWYGLLGKRKDVFRESYPEYDESRLKRAETEYAVQVNSKVRARVKLPSDADAKELERLALADGTVKGLLNGAAVKKAIVIPGRLINLII